MKRNNAKIKDQIAQPEWIKVILVYAGVRISSSNKKMYCYYDETDLTTPLYFVGHKLGKLEVAIGTAISCEKSETDKPVAGTTFKKSEVFNRILPSHNPIWDHIKVWSFESKASILKLRELSEAKKEKPGSIEQIVKDLQFNIRMFSRTEDRKRLVRFICEEIFKTI